VDDLITIDRRRDAVEMNARELWTGIMIRRID